MVAERGPASPVSLTYGGGAEADWCSSGKIRPAPSLRIHVMQCAALRVPGRHGPGAAARAMGLACPTDPASPGRGCATMARPGRPKRPGAPPRAGAHLAALIARVADGDGAALAALYDATCGLVFSLALRILRDRAAAEDVTIEVFLQVYSHAVGYHPD